MKKLVVGITGGIIVFVFFLICQNNFAQGFNKKLYGVKDDINKVTFEQWNNKVISNLTQKVEDMQKYVDAGERNLDKWLTYLALLLSIIIGASIFNGLKSRDLAKEELSEIRRIREDINRVVSEAEDRLKIVKDKITQIENSAISAKSIESEMTIKLKEFGDRSDLTLDEAQNKKLDDFIAQSITDLKNNGIETLKNLYYAKSLKAQNDKKWDDLLRLANSYMDLDETNDKMIFRRGHAYQQLSKIDANVILKEKAIEDYNEGIRINPNNAIAYNNRANLFLDFKDPDKAISDYNEAIKINPNYAVAFRNRAIAYKRKGSQSLSASDFAKAIELDPTLKPI